MKINIAALVRSAAAFATLGLVTAGCGGKGAGRQMPPPEVACLEIQPERLELTAELAGRASAFLVAEVRPQVNGIIQKRLFEEGADVKQGDILYQIDPALYEAAYSGAKASLARAEANLSAIRFRAERYKELSAINAVSRQNYDDAFAALKQAEAEIEAAKAAAETARINLAYTRISAPISGRIGKSSVTIGALVTAHQPVALAVIQQMDPIYVDVLQSTADVLRLQRRMADGRLRHGDAGQNKVKLIMEDGLPYPHPGTMQFRDVSVDPTSGSVILRIVFPNPDKALLPGMYVRAVVSEGVDEKAILVPQQAVLRDPRGNATVMVVGDGDKVESRAIAAERSIGARWLVSGGLKPSDRVIVEGLQKVRPGMPVRTVRFEQAKTAMAPTGDASQNTPER